MALALDENLIQTLYNYLIGNSFIGGKFDGLTSYAVSGESYITKAVEIQENDKPCAVVLHHNHVVNASDSIAGYAKVITAPLVNQYRIHYGSKNNPTWIEFNIADINKVVSVSYTWKPAVIIGWYNAVHGIDKNEISLPCIAIELRGGDHPKLGEGMDAGSKLYPRQIILDLYCDIDDRGVIDDRQRMRITDEILAKFIGAIPFYDWTVIATPVSLDRSIVIKSQNFEEIIKREKNKFDNRVNIIVSLEISQ